MGERLSHEHGSPEPALVEQTIGDFVDAMARRHPERTALGQSAREPAPHLRATRDEVHRLASQKFKIREVMVVRLGVAEEKTA